MVYGTIRYALYRRVVNDLDLIVDFTADMSMKDLRNDTGPEKLRGIEAIEGRGQNIPENMLSIARSFSNLGHRVVLSIERTPALPAGVYEHMAMLTRCVEYMSSALPENSFDEGSFDDDLRHAIDALAHAEIEKQERIEELERELGEVRGKLDDATEELCDGRDADTNDIEVLTQEVAELKAKLSATMQEMNGHIADAEDSKMLLRAAESERDSLQNQLDLANGRLAAVQKLAWGPGAQFIPGTRYGEVVAYVPKSQMLSSDLTAVSGDALTGYLDKEARFYCADMLGEAIDSLQDPESWPGEKLVEFVMVPVACREHTYDLAKEGGALAIEQNSLARGWPRVLANLDTETQSLAPSAAQKGPTANPKVRLRLDRKRKAFSVVREQATREEKNGE